MGDNYFKKVEYTVVMNLVMNTNYLDKTTAVPMNIGLHHHHVREYSKGETLYYLGDEAEAVFRIEEGLLKLSIDMLTGRERIISIAGPGDFIGAITPFHNDYQDTAETLSPVVKITAIPLNQIDNSLNEALHQAAGIHLLRLREALEDTELPVNARLARTLLRLASRFGHVNEKGTMHLSIPLTHENLASLIGAARETTTAILGEMRQDGLITGTRGHYSFNFNDLSEFAVASAF